jgi:manganese transport protein
MNRTVDPTEPAPEELGWRFRRTDSSLPEVHRSVSLPRNAIGRWGFIRKLLAFSGPGYLVAVGYMDPGNWATALAGGSQFYYTLLSAVVISSLMAILLQHLALKLGVATGRDLAQLAETTSTRRSPSCSGLAKRLRSPLATSPR